MPNNNIIITVQEDFIFISLNIYKKKTKITGKERIVNLEIFPQVTLGPAKKGWIQIDKANIPINIISNFRNFLQDKKLAIKKINNIISKE